MDDIKAKRKRRSKEDLEGRIFVCVCGKKYFSQQALYYHKLKKHSDKLSPDELVKRKRGRPKHLKDGKGQNFSSGTDSQDKYFELFKVAKKSRKGTCEEVFSEYLEKKQKIHESQVFFEIKDMISSLRDCINRYSEKIDLNDFFYYESYSITEKADLMPNIASFFIREYLHVKKPGCEMEREAGYLLEFFRWMKMKEYTKVDVNEFFNSD